MKQIDRQQKISMLKDGEWVEWDGSDVRQLMVEETMTLAEIKECFPEQYERIKKEVVK